MRIKLAIILFGLLLGYVSVLKAQYPSTEQADKQFEKELYESAISSYERLLKKGLTADETAYVQYKIGEAYYLQELFYNEAAEWFTKALQSGYDEPELYLHLGDATLQKGDYETAQSYLQTYLQMKPGDERGTLLLESCYFAIDQYKKEPVYSIKNEKTLNTYEAEYSVTFMPSVAILYDDAKLQNAQYDKIPYFYYDKIYWADISLTPKDRIVFTSSRSQQQGRDEMDFGVSDDIYEALYNKKEGKWEDARKLKGGVNSNRNNTGIFSYNEKNKIAYFQRCNSAREKSRYCNIYYANYDENTNSWSEANEFKISTKDYVVGHPNLSDDGSTLYFASNMPGGFGGGDLYKIEKTATGDWGEPVNLGPNINTPYDEGFPHARGTDLLYFASKGHVGMGGYDVFYTNITGDQYSEPVNMGIPINSTADDFSLIFVPGMVERGFFCSNRSNANSVGSDDIYSFEKKPDPFAEKGNITDNIEDEFKKPPVLISGYGDKIKDMDTVSTVEKTQIIDTVEKIEVPVDTNINNDDDFVNTDIETYSKINKNQINNIYWDFDKFSLRDISKQELDGFASMIMNDQNNGYIIIRSYADEQGTENYNKYLSQLRAKSVVDYLLSKGVDKDRLLGIGLGESELVVEKASSDEEHQLNRRTAFDVLSYDKFIEFLAFSEIYSSKHNYNKKVVYYGKHHADPTGLSAANNIEFRVQFIATRKPIDPEFYQKIEEKMPDEIINTPLEPDPDGFYRYSVGKYKNISEAYQTQRKLKNYGYETYISAFNNGVKISVNEAKRLIKN